MRGRINPWPVVVLVALVGASVALASHPVEQDDPVEQEESWSGARYGISSTPRPLRFAKSTSRRDRKIVLSAIAHARPEARRLARLVAGLVTVGVGPVEDDFDGVTSETSAGYDVELDLHSIPRELGELGIERLIMHELGHVLDATLIPMTMEERLDATIPHGPSCNFGQDEWCADRAERFAETFAKWATGNSDDLGYEVPTPASLERWGAPLVRLAA